MWPEYGDDEWLFHIEYDRAKRRATLRSKNPRRNVEESCDIDESYAFVYGMKKSAIHINAFHLLMCRKYDPREFSSVENDNLERIDARGIPCEIPVIVIRSEKTVLRCEKKTGDLLQAEFLMQGGPLVVDLSAYRPVDELSGVRLAMISRIAAPGRLFAIPPAKPDPEGFKGVIHLSMDPEKIIAMQ